MAAEAKNKPAPSKKATKKDAGIFSLSAEFVHDSDDEDEETSDEESDSDEESLPKDPAATLPGAKANDKLADGIPAVPAVPAAEDSSSNGSESSESRTRSNTSAHSQT